MTPPPANIRRHFLAWDQPLLPQAVRFLAGDWAGRGPLDLSSVVVLVPTRQSGRRLREALANHAAAAGAAVFPPRVLTPEALLEPSAPDVASRLESLLAWTEVLQSLDFEAARSVFPVDPPARNFAWALGLAQAFARLQITLAEGTLRIGDVAARVGAGFVEAARWRELGELEARHAAALGRRGLRSQAAAMLAAESELAARQGVERVVVLAAAELTALARARLAKFAERAPIDVVVFAPAEDADAFDAWGCPAATAWADRQIAIPDFEQYVHLCADPAEQAARIAGLGRDYAAPEGALGVGIADPEVLPLLESELARALVPAFNPEGRPRRDGSLSHLLSALAEFARAPTFAAVQSLARCPDVLAFFTARDAANFSGAAFLKALDDLHTQHLPADLSAARRHARAGLADALAVFDQWHVTLRTGVFPENIATVLAAIFASRRVTSQRASDVRLEDAAGAWTDVLRACLAARERFPDVASADWWELALRLFGDSRRTEDKPAGAVELQGWMELLFEDAPHLVVAGFNDGHVPESVVGDAFLPESLRTALGLQNNAGRFARDAYLLQAMVACRRHGGRLDVLFGRSSAAGDPLRPSRLLLRCADEELPARIAFLFRSPPPANAHLPWSRAWRLTPPVLDPPARVAVTALRRWLACPFRFYLHSVLRMQPVDPAKSEMDAFDFGTLCHGALEAMGRESALRDCVDAALLREFLLGELTRQAHARYGADLTLPLLIQLESARQRLSKLADVQARERAAGWVIEDVERTFTVEIGGLVVSGKIDRIDRHLDSGAIRVLDYKTSDTAVAPRAAHIRPLRSDESPPAWAQLVLEGKSRVWTDLQLPLYRHALSAEFGSAIACGYVNLPKATAQTAVALWEDFSLELQSSAIRCAEGVCAAIRAGEFWPPDEQIRAESDDFATLFHHGAAESVAWGAAPAAERGGAS